eukprot:6108119-Pyramimonas_sp.AAC.1
MKEKDQKGASADGDTRWQQHPPSLFPATQDPRFSRRVYKPTHRRAGLGPKMIRIATNWNGFQPFRSQSQPTGTNHDQFLKLLIGCCVVLFGGVFEVPYGGSWEAP